MIHHKLAHRYAVKLFTATLLIFGQMVPPYAIADDIKCALQAQSRIKPIGDSAIKLSFYVRTQISSALSMARKGEGAEGINAKLRIAGSRQRSGRNVKVVAICRDEGSDSPLLLCEVSHRGTPAFLEARYYENPQDPLDCQLLLKPVTRDEAGARISRSTGILPTPPSWFAADCADIKSRKILINPDTFTPSRADPVIPRPHLLEEALLYEFAPPDVERSSDPLGAKNLLCRRAARLWYRLLYKKHKAQPERYLASIFAGSGPSAEEVRAEFPELAKNETLRRRAIRLALGINRLWDTGQRASLTPRQSSSGTKSGMDGDVVSPDQRKDAGAIDWEGGISYGVGRPQEEVRFKAEAGDFMEVLKNFLAQKGIKDGIIRMTQRGVLKDPTTSFFMTAWRPSVFDRTLHEGNSRVVDLTGTIVGGAPHIHVLLEPPGGGERFAGGHLLSTAGCDIEVTITPLIGYDGRHVVDTDTGVGHFRPEKRPEEQRYAFIKGNSIFFTIAKGEMFPDKLSKIINQKIAFFNEFSNAPNMRRKIELKTAIGTFKSVEIQEDGKESNAVIAPEDGLELLWASGEILSDGETSELIIRAGLMDRQGNYYSGRFVKGVVKDLVEGSVVFLTEDAETREVYERRMRKAKKRSRMIKKGESYEVRTTDEAVRDIQLALRRAQFPGFFRWLFRKVDMPAAEGLFHRFHSLCKRLWRRVAPEYLIMEPELLLFGSYAEDRQDRWSDLDLIFTDSAMRALLLGKYDELFNEVKHLLQSRGYNTESFIYGRVANLNEVIRARRQGIWYTDNRCVWLVTADSSREIDLLGDAAPLGPSGGSETSVRASASGTEDRFGEFAPRDRMRLLDTIFKAASRPDFSDRIKDGKMSALAIKPEPVETMDFVSVPLPERPVYHVTDKKPKGVVVIGAGYMGPRHLAALKRSIRYLDADIRLIGLVEDDDKAFAAKVRAARKVFRSVNPGEKAPPSFHDLEEALMAAAEEGLAPEDIIAVVCTSNEKHKRVCLDLAARGVKMISVEKPLANTARDIDQICRLEKQGGLRIVCTTQFPFSAAFGKTLSFIDMKRRSGLKVRYWTTYYSKDRSRGNQARRNIAQPHVFMFELIHQLAMAMAISPAREVVFADAEDMVLPDGTVLRRHARGAAAFEHEDGMRSLNMTDLTKDGEYSSKEKIINIYFDDGSVLAVNLAPDQGYHSRFIYYSADGKKEKEFVVRETVMDMLAAADARWLHALIEGAHPAPHVLVKGKAVSPVSLGFHHRLMRLVRDAMALTSRVRPRIGVLVESLAKYTGTLIYHHSVERQGPSRTCPRIDHLQLLAVSVALNANTPWEVYRVFELFARRSMPLERAARIVWKAVRDNVDGVRDEIVKSHAWLSDRVLSVLRPLVLAEFKEHSLIRPPFKCSFVRGKIAIDLEAYRFSSVYQHLPEIWYMHYLGEFIERHGSRLIDMVTGTAGEVICEDKRAGKFFITTSPRNAQELEFSITHKDLDPSFQPYAKGVFRVAGGPGARLSVKTPPVRSSSSGVVAERRARELAESLKEDGWYVRDAATGVHLKAVIRDMSMADLDRCRWDWHLVTKATCRKHLKRGFKVYALTVPEKAGGGQDEEVEGMIVSSPHTGFSHGEGMDMSSISILAVLPRNCYGSKERKLKGVGTALMARAVADSVSERQCAGRLCYYTDQCDCLDFFRKIGMVEVPDRHEGWRFYFSKDRAQDFLTRFLLKGMIVEADGNVSEVARRLGRKYSYIRSWIIRLGLRNDPALDDAIRAFWKDGLIRADGNVSELVRRFSRKHVAVRSRLKKLGLMNNPDIEKAVRERWKADFIEARGKIGAVARKHGVTRGVASRRLAKFKLIGDPAVEGGIRKRLEEALAGTGGNVAALARKFGLSRGAVAYELRRFGVRDPNRGSRRSSASGGAAREEGARKAAPDLTAEEEKAISSAISLTREILKLDLKKARLSEAPWPYWCPLHALLLRHILGRLNIDAVIGHYDGHVVVILPQSQYRIDPHPQSAKVYTPRKDKSGGVMIGPGSRLFERYYKNFTPVASLPEVLPMRRISRRFNRIVREYEPMINKMASGRKAADRSSSSGIEESGIIRRFRDMVWRNARMTPAGPPHKNQGGAFVQKFEARLPGGSTKPIVFYIKGTEPAVATTSLRVIDEVFPHAAAELYRSGRDFLETEAGPNPEVLELGCGPGTFLRFLTADERARTTGLDYMGVLLARLRREFSEVRTIECDWLKMDEKIEAVSFDACTSVDSIHVVRDIEELSLLIGQMDKALRVVNGRKWMVHTITTAPANSPYWYGKNFFIDYVRGGDSGRPPGRIIENYLEALAGEMERAGYKLTVKKETVRVNVPLAEATEEQKKLLTMRLTHDRPPNVIHGVFGTGPPQTEYSPDVGEGYFAEAIDYYRFIAVKDVAGTGVSGAGRTSASGTPAKPRKEVTVPDIQAEMDLDRTVVGKAMIEEIGTLDAAIDAILRRYLTIAEIDILRERFFRDAPSEERLYSALVADRPPKEDLQEAMGPEAVRKIEASLDSVRRRLRELGLDEDVVIAEIRNCLDLLYRKMPPHLFRRFYTDTVVVKGHGLPHALDLLAHSLEIVGRDPSISRAVIDLKGLCRSAIFHDLSCILHRPRHQINSIIWMRAICKGEPALTAEEVLRIEGIMKGHDKAARDRLVAGEEGDTVEARLLHDADMLSSSLNLDRIYETWVAWTEKETMLAGGRFVNKFYMRELDNSARMEALRKDSYRLADGITDIARHVWMRRDPKNYLTDGGRRIAADAGTGLEPVADFIETKRDHLKTFYRLTDEDIGRIFQVLEDLHRSFTSPEAAPRGSASGAIEGEPAHITKARALVDAYEANGTVDPKIAREFITLIEGNPTLRVGVLQTCGLTIGRLRMLKGRPNRVISRGPQKGDEPPTVLRIARKFVNLAQIDSKWDTAEPIEDVIGADRAALFTQEEAEALRERGEELAAIYEAVSPSSRRLILRPDIITVLLGVKHAYVNSGVEPSIVPLFKESGVINAAAPKHPIVLSDKKIVSLQDAINRFNKEGERLVDYGVITAEELECFDGDVIRNDPQRALDMAVSLISWDGRNINAPEYKAVEGFIIGYPLEDVIHHLLWARKQGPPGRLFKSIYGIRLITRGRPESRKFLARWDMAAHYGYTLLSSQPDFKEMMPKDVLARFEKYEGKIASPVSFGTAQDSDAGDLTISHFGSGRGDRGPETRSSASGKTVKTLASGRDIVGEAARLITDKFREDTGLLTLPTQGFLARHFGWKGAASIARYMDPIITVLEPAASDFERSGDGRLKRAIMIYGGDEAGAFVHCVLELFAKEKTRRTIPPLQEIARAIGRRSGRISRPLYTKAMKRLDEEARRLREGGDDRLEIALMLHRKRYSELLFQHLRDMFMNLPNMMHIPPLEVLGEVILIKDYKTLSRYLRPALKRLMGEPNGRLQRAILLWQGRHAGAICHYVLEIFKDPRVKSIPGTKEMAKALGYASHTCVEENKRQALRRLAAEGERMAKEGDRRLRRAVFMARYDWGRAICDYVMECFEKNKRLKRMPSNVAIARALGTSATTVSRGRKRALRLLKRAAEKRGGDVGERLAGAIAFVQRDLREEAYRYLRKAVIRDGRKILPGPVELSRKLGVGSDTISKYYYSRALTRLKKISNGRVRRAVDYYRDPDGTIAKYIISLFETEPKRTALPSLEALAEEFGISRKAMSRRLKGDVRNILLKSPNARAADAARFVRRDIGGGRAASLLYIEAAAQAMVDIYKENPYLTGTPFHKTIARKACVAKGTVGTNFKEILRRFCEIAPTELAWLNDIDDPRARHIWEVSQAPMPEGLARKLEERRRDAEQLFKRFGMEVDGRSYCSKEEIYDLVAEDTLNGKFVGFVRDLATGKPQEKAGESVLGAYEIAWNRLTCLAETRPAKLREAIGNLKATADLKTLALWERFSEREAARSLLERIGIVISSVWTGIYGSPDIGETEPTAEDLREAEEKDASDDGDDKDADLTPKERGELATFLETRLNGGAFKTKASRRSSSSGAAVHFKEGWMRERDALEASIAMVDAIAPFEINRLTVGVSQMADILYQILERYDHPAARKFCEDIGGINEEGDTLLLVLAGDLRERYDECHRVVWREKEVNSYERMISLKEEWRKWLDDADSIYERFFKAIEPLRKVVEEDADFAGGVIAEYFSDIEPLLLANREWLGTIMDFVNFSDAACETIDLTAFFKDPRIKFRTKFKEHPVDLPKTEESVFVRVSKRLFFNGLERIVTDGFSAIYSLAADLADSLKKVTIEIDAAPSEGGGDSVRIRVIAPGKISPEKLEWIEVASGEYLQKFFLLDPARPKFYHGVDMPFAAESFRMMGGRISAANIIRDGLPHTQITIELPIAPPPAKDGRSSASGAAEGSMQPKPFGDIDALRDKARDYSPAPMRISDGSRAEKRYTAFLNGDFLGLVSLEDMEGIKDIIGKNRGRIPDERSICYTLKRPVPVNCFGREALIKAVYLKGVIFDSTKPVEPHPPTGRGFSLTVSHGSPEGLIYTTSNTDNPDGAAKLRRALREFIIGNDLLRNRPDGSDIDTRIPLGWAEFGGVQFDTHDGPAPLGCGIFGLVTEKDSRMGNNTIVASSPETREAAGYILRQLHRMGITHPRLHCGNIGYPRTVFDLDASKSVRVDGIGPEELLAEVICDLGYVADIIVLKANQKAQDDITGGFDDFLKTYLGEGLYSRALSLPFVRDAAAWLPQAVESGIADNPTSLAFRERIYQLFEIGKEKSLWTVEDPLLELIKLSIGLKEEGGRTIDAGGGIVEFIKASFPEAIRSGRPVALLDAGDGASPDFCIAMKRLLGDAGIASDFSLIRDAHSPFEVNAQTLARAAGEGVAFESAEIRGFDYRKSSIALTAKFDVIFINAPMGYISMEEMGNLVKMLAPGGMIIITPWMMEENQFYADPESLEDFAELIPMAHNGTVERIKFADFPEPLQWPNLGNSTVIRFPKETERGVSICDRRRSASGAVDAKLARLKGLLGRDDVRHARDLNEVLATIDKAPLDTIYLVDEIPDDPEEEEFRKYFLDKYEASYSLVVIDGEEYFIVVKSDFDAEKEHSAIVGGVSLDIYRRLKKYRSPFHIHVHHTLDGILPSVGDYTKTRPSPVNDYLLSVGRFYMAHPLIGFVEYYYDEDAAGVLPAGLLAGRYDEETVTIKCFTGSEMKVHPANTEKEACEFLMKEFEKGCWAFDVDFGSGYKAVWRKGRKFSEIREGKPVEAVEEIERRSLDARLAQAEAEDGLMTANEILDREGVIIEAVKEITGVLDIKTAPATATRDIIVPEEFIERQGTNVTRLNKRLREVSIGGRSYGVVAKPLSEIETELKSGYYTKRARGKQVKTPFNRQNAIAILRPDTIRSVAAGLGSKAVSECSFLPVELPADADYYFILPAMVNLAIGVDALLFDEKSELAGPLEALYKAVSGSEKTIDPSLLKDLFGRDAGCIERLISLFTVTLPRCRQLINDLPELRKMEDAISAAA